MRISFESCGLHQIDAVAFYAAVAALTRHLADPDWPTLVLSGDYERSIKARLGNDQSSEATFSATRINGLNVAKVMPRGENSCDVVVNAGLLSVDGDWLDDDFRHLVLRIFAHEGRHVRTRERREGIHYLQQGAPGGPAAAYYRKLADILIDEYRAERALNDIGWAQVAPWTPEHLETAFGEFGSEVQNTLPIGSQEKLNELYGLVYRRFSEVITPCAYVAAEWLAQSRHADDHPYANSPIWRRFVGGHWPALLEALRYQQLTARSWGSIECPRCRLLVASSMPTEVDGRT